MKLLERWNRWVRETRSQQELHYLDVSSRDDVEEEATVVSEILDRLGDLRFELAGYMEQRTGKKSFITMVLVDPEGLSFTRPEWLFELPHVSFKTLLEDGTLVDTRNIARYPILDLLPLFAPYQHHPAAGYLLENMGREPPEEVWARHRTRVKEIMAERRTRVRPHDMAMCTAAMNRSWAIASKRSAIGVSVGLPAWLSLSLLAFLCLPTGAAILETVLGLPLSLIFVGGFAARRWPYPPEPPTRLLGVAADHDSEGRLLH